MSKILNFELLPNIQNTLDWHKKFTTISKLQGKYNPINFIEKKMLDEGDTRPQSCSYQNVVWGTQIELVNF